MDQYKKFCRLRDYRAPGAEVCAHTEAEAFALANKPPGMAVARDRSVIGKLMDEISTPPVLWGLNEPGALLRNSDVFRVLAAAGHEHVDATIDTAIAARKLENNGATA